MQSQATEVLRAVLSVAAAVDIVFSCDTFFLKPKISTNPLIVYLCVCVRACA